MAWFQDNIHLNYMLFFLFDSNKSQITLTCIAYSLPLWKLSEVINEQSKPSGWLKGIVMNSDTWYTVATIQSPSPPSERM